MGDRAFTLRRGDSIGLMVALMIFVGSGLVVTQGLAPGEEAVFVAINSLPDYMYVVIWPFMQYGVFLTIPVLSIVAFALRRMRLAITMAIAGVGVYLLARMMKEVVQR